MPFEKRVSANFKDIPAETDDEISLFVLRQLQQEVGKADRKHRFC